MCIKLGRKNKTGLYASFSLFHPCQAAEGIWKEALRESWAWSILGGAGVGRKSASLVPVLGLRDPNLGWKGLEIRVGVSHPGLVEAGC